MMKIEKISPIQMFFLIVAVIWGDSIIISPASNIGTDAWLAFIIGWTSSFPLIGLYIYIAKMYYPKTFIEILRECFGSFFGSVIGMLYIWYFIHISSLVFRSFGEYLVVTTYPETPRIYISVVWMLVLVYSTKKGIEVLGRVSELLVPTVFIVAFSITLLSIGKIDLERLQPFLKADILTILKASFHILTFPFGETVVFLMIFPHINKKEALSKTTFLSLFVSGLVLLILLLRNISILGADFLSKTTFPSDTITTLLPSIVLEPFIAVNLLITGGFQTIIFSYAAMVGISQLLKLDHYKPFVFPVFILCVSLSNWIYEDLTEMFRVAQEIYPYYAIPFQIIIPLLILLISFIKKMNIKKQENNESNTESA